MITSLKLGTVKDVEPWKSKTFHFPWNAKDVKVSGEGFPDAAQTFPQNFNIFNMSGEIWKFWFFKVNIFNISPVLRTLSSKLA